MCGIAGLIHLDNNHINLSETASRMMDALEHRGPDSFGYHIVENESVLLVHRRLAILDLSAAGNQPMFSKQDRFSIVFNGEIYNFTSLAKDLEKLGHNFISHSDTEVVLAAIEAWGLKSALQRFVGMFAFALWDNQDKILYLCRDRLGEKPLYYGWVGNSFYFSSELKAIESVVPAARLNIDQQALARYFKYGYINAPWSIYEGIYKLIPASYLVITKNNVKDFRRYSPHVDDGTFSPRPYWSLLSVANAGTANPYNNENEAIDALDDLLRKTVSIQKTADVKVGTFLSGGIDSSLVTAVTQAESEEKIKTFTIGFEQAEFDESVYAEQIAKYLGTDHTTVSMSGKDALDMVPKLCNIYDEPFADSSQIPTCLVSEIAHRDVTVCLSGDGGDELFSGYNRYTWTESIWNKIKWFPLPARKLVSSAMDLPKPESLDNFYKLLHSGNKSDNMTSQRSIGLKIQKLSEFIKQGSLEEGYQYLSSYWNDPDQLLTQNTGLLNTMDYYERPKSREFIEQAMFWDQINYLPGDNLAKVDRASMAVGLETRLPLLSHEIVELSWRIPTTMKVKDGNSKWLLKQLLYKYIPRELVDRPKMGFSVPVAHWLRNELHEWSSDLLSSDILKNSDLFNHDAINKVWQQHLKGEKDHALKLWGVLMFLSWSER